MKKSLLFTGLFILTMVLAQPIQSETEKAPLVNKFKMEFVAIPAGTFLMGSPSNEADRDSNESQDRNGDGIADPVTLTQSFEIMQTEVTQRMWKEVMGENPSYFKGDDLPVEQVSWNDVQTSFIDRLNQTTNDGYTYRLPTEAEWEYAARAGTQTAFNLGDNITPDQVNYDGNYPYKNAAEGENRERTVPVGSLPNANAWGLYDMHGNVWEWVLDPYSSNYSKALSQEDALNKNLGTGSSRVIRGGGWDGPAQALRSAFRIGHSPGYRIGFVGFRLVRTKN